MATIERKLSVTFIHASQARVHLCLTIAATQAFPGLIKNKNMKMSIYHH